jgi:hypothetical protein
MPANTSGDQPGPLSALLAPHAETDPDLARIAAAWPGLPEHIRQAILALVAAAR